MNAQNKKNSRRKDIFIGCIATILIAIAAWITYDHFKPAPVYPLGDSSKLEYVGNTGYGCWIVCDANPAENYYYATDMSVEEVVKYFKEAKVNEEPSELNGIVSFSLKTKKSEIIYIDYFPTKSALPKSIGDFAGNKTQKKHFIEVPSFKYTITKESL